MLMGEYFARTGDRETGSELWPQVKAALQWIDNYATQTATGFAYDRRSAQWLGQSGFGKGFWRTRSFTRTGGLPKARSRCARCRDSLRRKAARRGVFVLAGFGRNTGITATRLDAPPHSKRAIAAAFEAAFWCEDLSTYALALDGAKLHAGGLPRTAGHALLTGIVAPDPRPGVRRPIARRRLLSGWGIRTVGRSGRDGLTDLVPNGSVGRTTTR